MRIAGGRFFKGAGTVLSSVEGPDAGPIPPLDPAATGHTTVVPLRPVTEHSIHYNQRFCIFLLCELCLSGGQFAILKNYKTIVSFVSFCLFSINEKTQLKLLHERKTCIIFPRCPALFFS